MYFDDFDDIYNEDWYCYLDQIAAKYSYPAYADYDEGNPMYNTDFNTSNQLPILYEQRLLKAGLDWIADNKEAVTWAKYVKQGVPARDSRWPTQPAAQDAFYLLHMRHFGEDDRLIICDNFSLDEIMHIKNRVKEMAVAARRTTRIKWENYSLFSMLLMLIEGPDKEGAFYIKRNYFEVMGPRWEEIYNSLVEVLDAFLLSVCFFLKPDEIFEV